MGNIKIEKMVLGMVQTNTWFVINEKTKELILIDPADDAGRIIRKIEADGLKLQGILLTHGHFDHIGAAEELKAALLEKFPNAEIEIGVLRGLCSYYAEVGGVLVAYEGNLRA